MSDLLCKFPFEELCALAIVPVIPTVLYAMVTIFQYAEGIADQQAADEICTRMDWKYALQLPINYTGFDYLNLCEFRAGVRQSKLAQSGLERFIAYFTAQGLMSRRDRTTCASEVTRSVCMLNRLETLVNAMNQSLEVVAIHQSEWLQTMMGPHWIERYPWPAKSSLPVTYEKQELLARMIAEDAYYLLAAVEQTPDPGFSALPEIENLRKVCSAQVPRSETGLHWAPQDCVRCFGTLNNV